MGKGADRPVVHKALGAGDDLRAKGQPEAAWSAPAPAADAHARPLSPRRVPPAPSTARLRLPTFMHLQHGGEGRETSSDHPTRCRHACGPAVQLSSRWASQQLWQPRGPSARTRCGSRRSGRAESRRWGQGWGSRAHRWLLPLGPAFRCCCAQSRAVERARARPRPPTLWSQTSA